MLLEHSSFSFPSHLVPLGDLGLTLVCLVLFALLPRSVSWLQTSSRPWRDLSGGLRSLLLGGLAAALLAASFAVLGPPIPRVSDEVSYLFAAQTFAAGRLSNTPRSEGRALVYEHVLDEPTRQSKYPPAQGLLLAIGQLARHAWLGLLLGVALLVIAAERSLSRFVEAEWAAFGALFIALRLGIGGYWHQSYWGGGLAALGSLLVIAALGRWESEVRRGLCFAAGAVVLAASRPLEGVLLVAILAAALVLRSGVGEERRWRGVSRGALVAAVATGSAGLFLLLGYNRAVTGQWWMHPHLLYSASEVVGTHFVWEETADLAEAVGLVLRRGLHRAALVAFYVLGCGGLLAAVASLASLRRRSGASGASGGAGGRLSGSVRSHWAHRLVVWCWLCILAVGAVLALVRPFHAHYGAPAVGPLLLILVLGLRHLEVTEWRPHWARAVAPALLVSNLLLAVLQLPAHRPDAGDWSRVRARFDAELQAAPGKHLVWVDDRRGDPSSWAFPQPDPNEAKVLWIDGALVGEGIAAQAWRGRFGERQQWILRLERSGERLLRFGADSP